MSIESIKSVSATYQSQSATVKPQQTVQSVQPEKAVKSQVEAPKMNMQNIDITAPDDKKQTETNNNEQIKKAVSDLNKKMSNTSCQFGIHEGTNRVTIKIVDNDTKNVIKEYPAEETLEMIEKAWELAGIMVDTKL